MFKQLFCNHDYHLINQFTVKSEFDIAKTNGYIPISFNSLTRIYITDYKCIWCGKIKRLKIKTPN